MAATYKIEQSANNAVWLDITDYVELASWNGQTIGEDVVGSIQNGNVTFRIIDKHTDKATHYWYNLIQSQTAAYIRVTHVATGNLVFFGRVESTLCTFDGDCISTFTATSLSRSRMRTRPTQEKAPSPRSFQLATS